MLIFLSVVLFLIIIALLISAIDMNRFVVKRYTVESHKILKDMRAVVISDLHNKSYGKNNAPLIARIDSMNPDCILMTGDILTGIPGKDEKNALNLVKELSDKYPVYYVNGNHETRMRIKREKYGSQYDEYMEKLLNNDLYYLENTSKFMEEYNIRVTGYEIPLDYYKRGRRQRLPLDEMELSVGKAVDTEFQVLLAHNPDYFDTYVKWGADLTLSGHVHGGIVKLPVLGGVISPAYRLFPKYDGGLFESFDKKMILSRGLGSHTLPLRVFNPGELILVEFVSKKACKDSKR